MIRRGIPLELGRRAMLRMGGNDSELRGRRHLDSGALYLVEPAPQFSYSVYAVYSTRSEADLIDRVRTGLRICAARGSSS